MAMRPLGGRIANDDPARNRRAFISSVLTAAEDVALKLGAQFGRELVIFRDALPSAAGSPAAMGRSLSGDGM